MDTYNTYGGIKTDENSMADKITAQTKKRKNKKNTEYLKKRGVSCNVAKGMAKNTKEWAKFVQNKHICKISNNTVPLHP